MPFVGNSEIWLLGMPVNISVLAIFITIKETLVSNHHVCWRELTLYHAVGSA